VANLPAGVQAVRRTDHRQTNLNYLAWAKSYLNKVGAVDTSSRGVWSITKQGETVRPMDVRAVPSRVRQQVSDDKGAPRDILNRPGGANLVDLAKMHQRGSGSGRS
jgi:restriction system protein